MNRPYLVLVNGVLAKACLTKAKAYLTAKELRQKGYTLVSVAEQISHK